MQGGPTQEEVLDPDLGNKATQGSGLPCLDLSEAKEKAIVCTPADLRAGLQMAGIRTVSSTPQMKRGRTTMVDSPPCLLAVSTSCSASALLRV